MGRKSLLREEVEGTGVAWGPLWISVLISRLRQRAPESEFRNCILKPKPVQTRPGRQWARRVAPNGKSCPLPAITVKCALTQSFLKCTRGREGGKRAGKTESQCYLTCCCLRLHLPLLLPLLLLLILNFLSSFSFCTASSALSRSAPLSAARKFN